MHPFLMNEPHELVDDALAGFARAHATTVRWNPQPSYVVRSERAADKVALVSGGGSGHEPLHVGMVGHGMLDAAVPGAVFASPSARQVEEAGRAAHAGRGVLQIIKNYTGDVINFGLAADALEDDGIAVASVVVDDDVATDSLAADGPGRRGTGAVVAVEKLCGAAAEHGSDLDALAALGRRIVAGSRSFAVAVDAGTHPGEQTPSFDLPAGQMEFGVGIHGERGIDRRSLVPASELGELLVEQVAPALGLRQGDGVLALVNGLGSTQPLELYTLYGAVAAALDTRGVSVARSLVGTYVSSLNMAGASLTLVRLDDELTRLWDAPVRTPALTW